MLVVSTHPADHRHTNALRNGLGEIQAPGWAVVFGDRREMAVRALELHYDGFRVVHVCGGDTRHGTGDHPDHKTRDAISMLASVHFVANEFARENLAAIGITKDVYVTGAPGLDEVVAYAKTLDPERKRCGVFRWFPESVCGYTPTVQQRYGQRDFLERIANAELFATNSSAGLYEAPILETPVELVGDRQKGRRGPYHHPEGKAVETIVEIMKGYVH